MQFMVNVRVLVSNEDWKAEDGHKACREIEAALEGKGNVVRALSQGVWTLDADNEIAATILAGMAKAFFASAFADAVESAGGSFGAGADVMHFLPKEIDPAALHAADTLHFDMVRKNRAMSLAEIFLLVSDRLTPEDFGHYAAMQAMGHGVGLSDYGVKREEIDVPYVEFGSHSLTYDYNVDGRIMPGDKDSECQHAPDEDCMTCHDCGKCRESLNDEDICAECAADKCPECGGDFNYVKAPGVVRQCEDCQTKTKAGE